MFGYNNLGVAQKYTDKKTDDVKRLAYFGSEILGTEKIFSELPRRIYPNTLTTIEDFTDTTGWSAGKSYTLPDGSTGWGNNNGSSGSINKTYDTAFNMGSCIVFYAYLEKAYNPLLSFKDTDEGNSFEIALEIFIVEDGWQWVQLNKSCFYATAGNSSWDNIKRIAFRNLNSGGTICIGKIQTYTPKQPLITVQFDDGHESVYSKAYAYMKTKGIRGSAAICGGIVDVAPRLSRAQILEMQADGWEFLSHTYELVSLGDSGISLAETEYQITRNIDYLTGLNCGRSSYYYVPHITNICNIPEKWEIAKKYCTFHRNSIPGQRLQSIPVLNPLNVTRVGITQGASLSDATAWIDKAIETNLWLLVVFHMIKDTTTAGQSEWETSKFEGFIDYLYSQRANIKVVSVAEALCV